MTFHLVSSQLEVQNDCRSVPLEDLAHQICAAHKAVQEASANALAAALDAGDALIAARDRVSRNWESWLQQNCPLLALSTARLYVQLAHHRAEIESARKKDPDLSLRAARRLIAKPKKKLVKAIKGAVETTVMPNLATLLATEPEPNVTAALGTKDICWFMRVMPATKGRGPVLLRPSEMLRQVIGQVRVAASPEMTLAATEAAERQALAALTALAAALVDVDIDRITIINRYVKEKRCAKRKGRRAA
jgi:hypothetical protein